MGKIKSDVGLIYRLKYWRKKIKLPGWKISIKFDKEMSPKYYGCVDYRPKLRKANITIHYALSDQDIIDRTIIHELIHIAFINFNMCSLVRKYKSFCNFEEYMCDYIADLAVGIRSRKYKK